MLAPVIHERNSADEEVPLTGKQDLPDSMEGQPFGRDREARRASSGRLSAQHVDVRKLEANTGQTPPAASRHGLQHVLQLCMHPGIPSLLCIKV